MVRKRWVWITALCFVILTVAAYAANSNSVWESLGIELGAVWYDKQNMQVAARIGEEEVTKGEIELAKVWLTSQGKAVTREAVLNNLIYRKILVGEAKKRGLFPSRDEVLAYMDEIKRMPEEAKEKGIKITPESYALYKDFFTGLEKSGLSEEQYWRNEAVIGKYQEGMAIAKLRAELAKDWGFTPERIVTPQGVAEFEKKLEEFISLQRKRTRVEVLDPAVFQSLPE